MTYVHKYSKILTESTDDRSAEIHHRIILSHMTLTLILIQTSSKWIHWATLRHHSDLFWAATSTSSQVISILNQSLLTAPPVCTRTTWTSLKPRSLPVQRLSRYALVIHLYRMSKPAESSFTEYVVHIVLSSSDSDLFVCYSVLPGNAQVPDCRPWTSAICDEQRSVFRRCCC